MWSEALNQAMRESTSNSCEQEGAGLSVTRQAGENIYSYVSSEKGSVRILRESNRNVFWTGGERKLEGGRDQGYLGICPSSPTLSTQVFQIGTMWSNHIYLSLCSHGTVLSSRQYCPYRRLHLYYWAVAAQMWSQDLVISPQWWCLAQLTHW